MLVSDKRYKDFTIRLKYKSVQGNSGLYFRADKVPGAVGVHGFQAEIDPANDVGGLYETGGRAWVVKPTAEEVKRYFKPGDWNEMTVQAQGRNVVVHVNGHKTAQLTDDPGRTEGHIGLQLHGGQDMHVEFKDITINWASSLFATALLVGFTWERFTAPSTTKRLRRTAKPQRWLTRAAKGSEGRESGKSAKEEKMGSNLALAASGCPGVQEGTGSKCREAVDWAGGDPKVAEQLLLQSSRWTLE